MKEKIEKNGKSRKMKELKIETKKDRNYNKMIT